MNDKGKYGNLLIFTLVLIVLVVIFSYGVGNVSAAGNTVYVNGVGGSDTYDGLSPVHTGTGIIGPKATIKNGVSVVTTNGILNIADGQYTGVDNTQITIDKNMNITGQSQKRTIINGTGTNWIFHINPGITVTMNNLTLTNGTTTLGGGAINNDGTLTVTNTTFTGNTATNSANAAGGAIYNHGSLNVTGCNFIGNAVTLNGFGGAIYNWGTLTVTNTTFIDNTAPDGGAICTAFGNVNVQFNRFIGNTAISGNAIYFENLHGGSVIATNNWWGSNNNPSNQIDSVSGSVSYSPWIYMNVTADPSTIDYGGNSSLTVSFNNLYDGTTITTLDPTTGHIPDGTPVTFNTAWGTITNIIPSSSTTLNGLVTATYHGNGATLTTPVTIYASTDNALVNTDINILQSPTTTVADAAHNSPGENVSLAAHVRDAYGNLVNEGQVKFIINGTTYAGSAYVANGLATLNWLIPSNWAVNNYNIVANYLGTVNYIASTNTSTLTVDPTPTAIIVKPITGYNGETVNLTATLKDTLNQLTINGKTIKFLINGNLIGSAVTNSNGIATLPYTIHQNVGTYTILAKFLNDTNYAASNNTNKLNVLKTIPPFVTKTDPTKNTVNVGVNKVIKITFNEPIKAGNMWIELKNYSTKTAKSFKTTITGNVLTIKPNSILAAGTKYIVILHSKSITDLTGFGFVRLYTAKFTTATITPKVISTIPSNQQTGFSRTKTITIKFNEKIKKSTNWSKIRMKNLSTRKMVSINQWIKGNTLNIKMVFLRYSHNWYQITIPQKAIKDNNGHKLKATYTFKFKTGA